MVVGVLIKSCQVSQSVKRIVGAQTTTSATQNVKNGALLTDPAQRCAKWSKYPLVACSFSSGFVRVMIVKSGV